MELVPTYRKQLINKYILKIHKNGNKNLGPGEVFLRFEGTPMTDLVG